MNPACPLGLWLLPLLLMGTVLGAAAQVLPGIIQDPLFLSGFRPPRQPGLGGSRGPLHPLSPPRRPQVPTAGVLEPCQWGARPQWAPSPSAEAPLLGRGGDRVPREDSPFPEMWLTPSLSLVLLRGL